ncbi:hypothetical protein ACWGH4_00095 [Streptomyces sp. NPDC054847]
MSAAAEAADHTPGQPSSGGVVLPMFKRRTRPAVVPPADNAAKEEPVAAQELAERIEALFHHHGMTLTDDEAAEVYGVTLDLVRMMHEGAHTDGVITAPQLAQLAAMVDGMRRAPQLL